MNLSPSIEILEARISPATLTATLVGTKLTITGSADADKGDLGTTGATGFNLGAQAGTKLIYNGTDLGDGGSITVTLPITDIAIDLGAGDDSFECFFSTVSKSLTVKGGAGSDMLKFVGLTVGGNFTIEGGGDNDTVLIEADTHVGKLDVNLGEGNNGLQLNFLHLFAEKSVTVKAGAGDDTLGGSLTSATLRSAGDFLIALGTGNDTVNLGTAIARPTLIETGGKLSIAGGNHAGTFTATVFAESLRVGKELSITTTGPGANVVAVDAFVTHVAGKTTIKSTGDVADTVSFFSSESVFVGPVVFDLGAGTNTTTFTGFTSSTFGSLAYKGGDGNDTFSFAGLDARVVLGLTDFKLGGGENSVTSNTPGSNFVLGGGLTVTSGSGKDTFKLQQRDLTIGGKGAKITDGPGNGEFLLSASSMGTLTVYGGVNASIGSGTSSFALSGANVAIRGGVSATFADGAGTFSLGGVTDLGGALNVTMKGGGDDTISLLTAKLSARGAVSFSGDAGKVTATITSNSAFRIGALNFTTKTGGGALTMGTGGQILGDLNYKGGSGPNTLLVGIAGFPTLDVFGKVSITSGTTTGTELFQLRRATVAGTVTAKFGAADTRVEIDDVRFSKAVTIDTGAGGDTLLVQRDAMVGGTAFFDTPFKFLLGAGDDVARLGGTGGVVFTGGTAALAKILVDGGAGTDTLDKTNFTDGMTLINPPAKNIETTVP